MKWIQQVSTVVAVALTAACGSDATMLDDGTRPSTRPPAEEIPVVPATDAGIFARAMGNGPWTWYKLSVDTLNPAANSIHDDRLRTRYNAHAATQHDALGKVIPTALFPDSSFIAKEIYRNGALLSVAVMVRAVGDPNAGHGDWLWAEFAANGDVLHSIAQSNETCHACHVEGVDHTRMNDAHS